jgi:DNA-binding CsgD family transcriptional regulator/tetratricopeptide (TPR) repeat protein
VGRIAQLENLRARLDSAVAGRGCLVLVSGEPGIGKTRLADGITDEAEQRGFQVAWGQCRETAGAPPYWPWVQVFRAAVGRRGASQVPIDDVLASVLYPGETTTTTPADRFRLFDAGVEWLAQAAEERPLLVVLDDLHRADEASLQFLRFVAPSLHMSHIVLLGTYRDTEVSASHPLARIVGEVASDTAFELLELTGFTLAETEEFVGNVCQAGIDVDVPKVHQRTGGNPFFLAEVLHMQSDRNADVPFSVVSAIRARVLELPETTREMLTFAAVLGREIDVQVLAVLVKRSLPSLTATLMPAVERRLITTQQKGTVSYRFVHVLVQQALYLAIPVDRRMWLHDRVLVALEQTVGANLNYASDLAHHAMRSIEVPGGQRRAFTLARRAARVASDRLAYEEAADWYTRALAIAPPSQDLRVELLLDLGRAAGRAGRTSDARQAFEQAWHVASAHDWPTQLGRAASGLGELIVSASTVDTELVRMLERTIDQLTPQDRDLSVRLTARLATELYWSSGLERARRLATEAVAQAREFGDQRTLAAALAAQQFVLRGPDGLEDRLLIGEELADIAVRLADDDLELLTRRVLIADRLQVDLEEANTELDEFARLVRSTRRPLARWYLLLFQATRAIMAGRSSTAFQLVDEAESLGRRIDVQPALVYAVGQRFLLLRQIGRTGEIEDDLRSMAASYPVHGAFRCMLTLLLADARRTEEAIALLDELVAGGCAALPRQALWLANVAMLAEAAAELDHSQHAATLHDLLEPYAGRIAMEGVIAWWGAVDRYLALTSSTLERWEQADNRFRAALRLHEAWAAVPLVEATLTGHAAMLRKRGGSEDRERASRLEAQAAAIPTSRPPRSSPLGGAGLTARETQVLDLLATGASNKHIARRLGVSVHTVERHVANVYPKIGARNRTEATALALHRRQ